jgi:cell division protein FtsL
MSVVAVKKGGGLPLSVILLELLPAGLLVALFAVVGVVHVTSRVLVVKAGYELSRLDTERQDLAREKAKLELELATLRSPSRLETVAREKLNLGPPAGGTVFNVGKNPSK